MEMQSLKNEGITKIRYSPPWNQVQTKQNQFFVIHSLKNNSQQAHYHYQILSEGDLGTLIRTEISNSTIRKKIHRTGIAFTRNWIDLISRSHITGYDSYPDKFYADRPCVHTYPFLSYPGKLFTCTSARRIVHWIDFVIHWYFQRRINIIRTEKGKLFG